MKEIKVCKVCGAKMVEYHHSLSKLLVNSLVKFHQEIGLRSVSLKDTKLTFSERTNFQKLRYWGLVEKGYLVGTWQIASEGELFLRGQHKTIERAVTYRGDLVRYEGNPIEFKDVTGYKYADRYDYAREATPVEDKNKQLRLA